uniref:Putative tick til 1 n=1 Tax=Amblyomma triste TaxID=251400 RepID=A0A023G8E6_AMBTT
MTKVTPAGILVLLAICAVVLLASAQSGPQALGAHAGVVGSRYPGWRPRPMRCPRNQVFKYCASSSCGERHCYELRRPGPRICTADCVYRCFCKKGWFRNSNGRCVRREQCKRIRPFPYPVVRPAYA